MTNLPNSNRYDPFSLAEDPRFSSFWGQFVVRAKDQAVRLLRPKFVPKGRWLYSAAGITHFRFVFMLRNDGRTEIHFEILAENESDNKLFFDRLSEHKSEIEDRFGATLIWDRCNENPGSYVRCITGRNLDLDQESDWEAIQEEMLAAMTRFIPVLEPYLNKLTV